jgi:hypothetical protein
MDRWSATWFWPADGERGNPKKRVGSLLEEQLAPDSNIGVQLLFLALVPVVFALELLDTPGRINVLHFAGEERMARGADFDGDVLFGTASDKLVAAPTGDGRLEIFRMDAFFHDSSPLIRLFSPTFANIYSRKMAGKMTRAIEGALRPLLHHFHPK